MTPWVLNAAFALLVVDFVALVIWVNKRQARKRAERGLESAEEEWDAPEWDAPKVNPATGYSMVSEGVDAGGNLYGECFTDDVRLDPFGSDGW